MPLLLFLIGAGVIVLAHSAPFPFLLDALAGKRGVWKMPPSHEGARVYLTFDDGPNPTATPALLDVLQQEQARATFFLIDRYVTPDTAPIVARMAAEGHDVALHSHTRALMMLSPEALAAHLAATADRIAQLTGVRPCAAFRPHAGFRSQQMYEGLARLDYVLVGWGWNLWDFNWFRRREARTIVPRLRARVSDGDIIVLHDGHHENPRADRRYAVETTRALIPALRSDGFAFGAVCSDLRSAADHVGNRRNAVSASPTSAAAGSSRPAPEASSADVRSRSGGSR